jgi:hypothetical protein
MKRVLDRRLFLRTAASATATVITTGGAVVIAASNGAWAMTLSTFDATTARVLLVMTRRLYPHDMLGDVYYAEVVESLDMKAKAEPGLAKTIEEGVAALDRATGVPWLQLSPGGQVEVLKAIETVALFSNGQGRDRGRTLQQQARLAPFRLSRELGRVRRLSAPRLPGRRVDDRAGRRGEPAAARLRSGRRTNENQRGERRWRGTS